MTNTPERVQMDGVNHQGFDPLQDLLAMRENPKILRAAAAHRSCVVREELIVCASLAAALRSQLPCELKTVADRRKIDFVAGRRCALLACRDVGQTIFHTDAEIVAFGHVGEGKAPGSARLVDGHIQPPGGRGGFVVAQGVIQILALRQRQAKSGLRIDV